MEEKVTILNKKGLKLSTVIHKPKLQGKYPCVIVIHGFTGDKEELHMKQTAMDLARNNIIAIRFDASGYGESEGETESEYRLSNHMSDIRVVYNYAKTLPEVDPKRIGLYGQSLGAMMAVLFAANNPDIKASVAVSPPYHMETHYRLKGIWKDWKNDGFLKKETEKGEVKIPWVFLEDSRSYDALKVVDKIHSPILFIIGSKDINVLPEETQKLYKQANQPKELFVVEEMDHFYKNVHGHLKLVNEKIVSFFKTNL